MKQCGAGAAEDEVLAPSFGSLSRGDTKYTSCLPNFQSAPAIEGSSGSAAAGAIPPARMKLPSQDCDPGEETTWLSIISGSDFSKALGITISSERSAAIPPARMKLRGPDGEPGEDMTWYSITSGSDLSYVMNSEAAGDAEVTTLRAPEAKHAAARAPEECLPGGADC